MDKRELRLGDEVLWGSEVAVVDALTQGCIGLVLPGGGYAIVGYSDVSIQREG